MLRTLLDLVSFALHSLFIVLVILVKYHHALAMVICIIREQKTFQCS